MERIAGHGLAIKGNRRVELALQLQCISVARHHVGSARAQSHRTLDQGERFGDQAALRQIDA